MLTPKERCTRSNQVDFVVRDVWRKTGAFEATSEVLDVEQVPPSLTVHAGETMPASPRLTRKPGDIISAGRDVSWSRHLQVVQRTANSVDRLVEARGSHRNVSQALERFKSIGKGRSTPKKSPKLLKSVLDGSREVKPVRLGPAMNVAPESVSLEDSASVVGVVVGAGAEPTKLEPWVPVQKISPNSIRINFGNYVVPEKEVPLVTSEVTKNFLDNVPLPQVPMGAAPPSIGRMEGKRWHQAKFQRTKYKYSKKSVSESTQMSKRASKEVLNNDFKLWSDKFEELLAKGGLTSGTFDDSDVSSAGFPVNSRGMMPGPGSPSCRPAQGVVDGLFFRSGECRVCNVGATAKPAPVEAKRSSNFRADGYAQAYLQGASRRRGADSLM